MLCMFLLHPLHENVCFILQFDSGIQRFMAMRATEYEHFKSTPKSALYNLGIVVIPIVVCAYLLKTTRVRYSYYSSY
jgi:hypothetical protein